MKFGFVTCVQLGLVCIKKIYQIGGELDLLITLHDHKHKKKSGRIYLDNFSRKHNICLLKVNHINDIEVIRSVNEHELDWLFIIGWSQIASREVISAPKMGCIGIHPSLLPEGRGRAAIPWAIIKDLKKTGVSMFKLDETVDTGEIFGQKIVPIRLGETATTLYKKINSAHGWLIGNIFPKLISDTAKTIKQDESKATYWDERTPDDGKLNEQMTIEQVDRLVRASTHPYPGAFLEKENEKIVIWSGQILCNGKVIPKNGFVLQFSNGQYLVTSYQKVKS